MTIQRYLLVVILSVVILASFSAALQGYKASNERLNQVFDEEMQSIAFALKNNATSQYKEEITHVDTHSSFAFQIWQGQQLKIQSKNTPKEKIANQLNGFGFKSFLGKHWRTFSLFEQQSQIIVAQPITQRIESIEVVLLEAILPIVYAIPLIGTIIFFAIRKSLQPVNALSKQLQRKSSHDLSPININANSNELAPIENTINQLLKRLENAFEREQSLASNAAHELRTPISVLKLNTHNIDIAFQSNNIVQQHIDELKNNTERMAHVIEQVITLNRTTPENFAEKKELFNLKTLLQDVISNNFEQIELRQQNISLTAAKATILADKFSLETLFDNLIKNAIKYSGLGASILVTINKSEKIFCTVEDSGEGIDDDKIAKALQRFYRIKQHQNEPGSGLGLSIVSHIVELHKGKLKLMRSSLGGLKVLIELPLPEEQ